MKDKIILFLLVCLLILDFTIILSNDNPIIMAIGLIPTFILGFNIGRYLRKVLK